MTTGLDVVAAENFGTVHLGPYWPGFSGLRYLFIFGDSYSSVGYNNNRANSAISHPNDTNPLGVKFPGQTWTEAGTPNWVGYLVAEFNKSKLLVFDYAVGGATAHDPQSKLALLRDVATPVCSPARAPVSSTTSGSFQSLGKAFLDGAGNKAARPRWAKGWNASNALFVSWIGINDIGRGWPSELSLDALFEAQEALYDAGARNFLFIDVPPMNRSPAVPLARAPVDAPYTSWNTQLSVRLTQFIEDHREGASVFRVSAFGIFHHLLDNPELHGLDSAGVRKAGGMVWMDKLHPTSAVHKIIAGRVAAFLEGIPPSASQLPFAESSWNAKGLRAANRGEDTRQQLPTRCLCQ
ncbi:carbohydrate esterase family 16 protein [Botryobasidium botryosum FD-172 SS1]|uniref:Carbohydrate esterase family 16 protein n=1 Tax=Botryobasidium botryosum (strain FD-172 SS1) TaxID=930990 RepID=A0A067M1D1_BOTB1|nr:carbohydrate esterase family 16 protein [Botryobasidium botryosum FD-172 SS1]